MSMRIGLTGGIGSGKSTVAKMLQSHGAKVVDVDAVSRALTATGGSALPAIVAAFGADALNDCGALDRQAMRQRIFADPIAKARLEAILHPLIIEAALAQGAQAAPNQLVVYDVPLLVETQHWLARVDQVWVVDADEATQLARVRARSPEWSDADARAAMAAQASRSERLAAAHVVLDNSGSIDELRAQVDAAVAEVV